MYSSMSWLVILTCILTIQRSISQTEGQLVPTDDDISGSLVAFDTTTENYTVPVSGKCVLTCYVAEVRSFKVLWQKIDRAILNGNQTNAQQQEQLTLIAFDGIVYSNKDHYRLESDYVGSYNLIIERVNEDDQGEYQCQINTEPRKTKRIFLTVQVPPRIVDFRPNPPLYTIVQGSSLTLSCRAEGTPTPNIRWSIRDVDANAIDLSPPDNSNVWFIPSVTNSFPRTVECIADNSVLPASNRIFTINVEYPPITSVMNDLIQSEIGKNVTIECQASSRPFSRIYWEKNGKMIEENQMSNTQLNQTMSINRLTIQMNNNDDFGQYNCIAENIHGRTNSIVFIHQILLSTTSIKTRRYSKHYVSRTNLYRITTSLAEEKRKKYYTHSHLTDIENQSFIPTTTSIKYLERGIKISSLSSCLRNSNTLLFILFLFQHQTIYR